MGFTKSFDNTFRLPGHAWVTPLAGSVLILIGCVQLVYATLAVAAVMGIRFLIGFIDIARGLVELGPDRSADWVVFSAMAIADV